MCFWCARAAWVVLVLAGVMAGSPLARAQTTTPTLAVTEVTGSSSLPIGYQVTATDGAMWYHTTGLYRMATTGVPTAIDLAGESMSTIVAGIDGNVWITTESGVIARISAAGKVTWFTGFKSIAQPIAYIRELTPAPDGSLLYLLTLSTPTNVSTQHLGRISATGSKTTLKTAGRLSMRSIAIAPDGTVWFTQAGSSDAGGGAIGYVTPAGTVGDFDTGSGFTPSDLIVGSDGNVWIEGTQRHSSGAHLGAVGRMTPAGVMTPYVFSIDSDTGRFGINSITFAGGSLWYISSDGEHIGNIGATGAIIEYVTQPKIKSRSISTGPDGTLLMVNQANGKTVRAEVQSLKTATIFSTAQTSSQSFVRFHNTGTTAGTVTVTLSHYITGQKLATWTSASIAPGSSPQVDIGTIEKAATTAFTKPSYYAMSIQAQMSGTFQHVLFRAGDSTITNLSTCSIAGNPTPTQIANVHSSLLGDGYPSSIVLHALGGDTIFTLGIYNAATGIKIGTVTTQRVLYKGRMILSIAEIEAALQAKVTAYHYVIKIEEGYGGTLQHLISNAKAGVITDMTPTCGLQNVDPITVAAELAGPALFPPSQPGSQSYLRFANTSATPGTVRVELSDASTGLPLVAWTSPVIQPGASPQVGISEIESAATTSFTRPDFYGIKVQSHFDGSFQHVLFRSSDGTITNLSTCGSGTPANATQLSNLHSSRLGDGYPSTVMLVNTGTAPIEVTFGVYDSGTGAKLGTVSTVPIPANGQAMIPVTAIEAKLPSVTAYHYTLKAENTFTGYLQHIVTNAKAGVITDMTPTCPMAKSFLITVNRAANASASTGNGYTAISGSRDSTVAVLPGARVIVTATPNPSSTFAGWDGCFEVLSGGDCRIFASADATLTPRWAKKPIDTGGGGGSGTIAKGTATGACVAALAGTWSNPAQGSWTFTGANAKQVKPTISLGRNAHSDTDIAISSCSGGTLTYKIVHTGIHDSDYGADYDAYPSNYPDLPQWSKTYTDSYSISGNVLTFGSDTYRR